MTYLLVVGFDRRQRPLCYLRRIQLEVISVSRRFAMFDIEVICVESMVFRSVFRAILAILSEQ
jgi:hypothetical protein